VDINQLEVLVTVAHERSFSRAADVLGRTQPAVSQSIRRLEQEIGERLFDRSSKDGTLTPAGEVLLDHVERGEERFLVEWDPTDGSVWYDILAFSRPRHPLVRASFPVARMLQKRFARDSMAVMKSIISAG